MSPLAALATAITRFLLFVYFCTFTQCGPLPGIILFIPANPFWEHFVPRSCLGPCIGDEGEWFGRVTDDSTVLFCMTELEPQVCTQLRSGREWHLRELGTRKLLNPEAGLESG